MSKPIYVAPGWVLCRREHASKRSVRRRFPRAQVWHWTAEPTYVPPFALTGTYGRDGKNRLWSIVADGGDSA